MRASILGQAAALTVVLATTFPLQAADPPPRSREVQELIDEAEKAARRLELDRARELWAQIYTLEHSTMALCQLGVFDRRLGRLEEAAEELSKCVEQMPAPTDDVERRRYEVRHADLAAVRQRVAELHVSPPPGTERLLVDGKQVSAGGGRVFVAPGQHEVMAMGKQGQVAHVLVQVAAGKSSHVSLAFETPKPPAAALEAPKPPAAALEAPKPSAAALEAPKPPAARAPAPAPVAPPPARSRPNPWIIGSGAAASAALLGAGVVLHLAGDAAEHEADIKAARLSEGLLIPSGAQFRKVYDEANAANSRAHLMRGFGTAALIAGATLGVATVVYVVFPRGNAEIRARAAGAEVKLAW